MHLHFYKWRDDYSGARGIGFRFLRWYLAVGTDGISVGRAD